MSLWYNSHGKLLATLTSLLQCTRSVRNTPSNAHVNRTHLVRLTWISSNYKVDVEVRLLERETVTNTLQCKDLFKVREIMRGARKKLLVIGLPWICKIKNYFESIYCPHTITCAWSTVKISTYMKFQSVYTSI